MLILLQMAIMKIQLQEISSYVYHKTEFVDVTFVINYVIYVKEFVIVIILPFQKLRWAWH